MAQLSIITWRDIPSQVVVRQRRRTIRVALSERFQHAIDRAAMRADKGGSDAYLAEWQRGEPRECGDDLQAEAEAAAHQLELRYSDDDLKQLIRQKGLASES